MDTEVAVIGAGPGGMQAAIDLAAAGVDVILLDPTPGQPEAPHGCVTIPRRSSILGHGPCGTPAGMDDWSTRAECPVHHIMVGGRTVIGRWESPEVLAYNFTRAGFWGLMRDGVAASGARIVAARVESATKDDDGITLATTAGDVQAKAAIHAAGVRGGTALAESIGLGSPPLVNGVFGSFDYDGEWNSPELSILVNIELVNHGYFWCAIAPRSKKVSIGILNEQPVNHALVWRFINTGIIPELEHVPRDIELERGILGAVSHVPGGGDGWPVRHVAPRVIGIGEGVGAIASYIYEGIFESRYQGMIAAKVLARAKQDNAWGSLAAYKRYENAWKPLDTNNLRMSRQQHYAMYHGGSNQVIDAYLKAFNARHKTVMAAMRANYLEFINMSRFELGLLGAILGNIPFMDKIPVTAHLVTARMQR